MSSTPKSTAFWVVLFFLGVGSLSAGQEGNLLTTVHRMHETRASHTATVLGDGLVLVTGGFRRGPDGYSQVYSRTAELFDPKTQAFTLTGEMHTERSGHTATLLPNGKVLIAGGFTRDGLTASMELYDPLTGLFAQTGAMIAPRGGFTATLLLSGDVLIVGGGDRIATTFAELFRTATGICAATGNLSTPRGGHTATLLPNGKVLIAGGGNGDQVFASTEIYDPATSTFSAAGSMHTPRYKHAAILLNDGHALLLGGSSAADWSGQYRSSEIYDWRPGKFTASVDLVSRRFKLPSAVVLLAGGNVVVCGGSKTIEVFDFLSKSFRSVGQLDRAYYFAAAVLLSGGRVLITGGYDDKLVATDKAWLLTQ